MPLRDEDLWHTSGKSFKPGKVEAECKGTLKIIVEEMSDEAQLLLQDQ